MLKTVIPSEAGQFFLALRSREALARAVEESLFSARSVLNPSFFSFNFQLSTSCLVLNCPSSPPSLASRLPPQVVRSSGRIVSPEQKEEQRRSFAYGNTNIENPRITRETV